jgi:hypothetical protein
MKHLFLLLAIIILANFHAIAQDWQVPKHSVLFKNGDKLVGTMDIDPGFRFADLLFEGKSYRIFYHRNSSTFPRARIVDNVTQKIIARGKGMYFFNRGSFVFDQEEVKLIQKRNPNGYTITGPNGTLFKVENHGVVPVKHFNDKDFLIQAFFLFERIRMTQKPPAEVVMIYTVSNL